MAFFPRLGGYVTEPDKICDELLVAVFASDYSQSNAFHGHVSSFQYLVHEAGTNFPALGTALETMFTELFNRYFAMSAVNVNIQPIENDSAKMKIQMYAVITAEDGRKYDFQSMIRTADGMAKEILIGDRVLWKSN